ncbi:MAG: pyridoxal phosphate-dependent aminotransferase family protein [Pseudomonadota bacterium]
MSGRPATAALSSPQGARVLLNGREAVMLGANNYLGLASHPAVVEAVVEATRRYGLGSCINPCFVHTPVHAALERELAAFLGVEDALLFASCSAANAGVLSTLAGRGDLVFSDRHNHASIIDGCRLSRAEARVYPYLGVESLEASLAAHEGGGGRLVITDGVFSMEGALAPLAELLSIANTNGAMLVVDDSHGLGVVGPRGRGAMAAAGLAPSAVVTTGTFSKALGGAPGGFVAGPTEIVARLRAESRAFIFTTGMSVPDAAGALAALRQLVQHPEHVERLWENTRTFRALLRERGVPVHDAASPITPLHVGDAGRAKALHAHLLELGVYVPAMVYPVVSHGQARLRAQPSAALSMDDVAFAANAIAQAFEEIPA